MNSPETRAQSAALPVEPALANGPAAAAILSAGVGCFALSLLAFIGDASKSIAKIFIFYRPTGPLSGVSTTAIVVWLAVWFALASVWKNKTVALAKINTVAIVFLLLGVLLTFPPFAELLLGT